MTGLLPICPDSPERYAQITAFRLPPCDGAALQWRLCDELRVELPIIEWNARQLVRLSVQGYNTLEDVEALTTALAHMLPSEP
jgi:selenocysteine lyase/cysteine desulfurase